MEKSKSRKRVANVQKGQEGAIKRTKALKYLAVFLAASFVFFVCFSFLLNGNLHKVWFSFFLCLAGVYLITRALFFHLDSNYLLGLVFFGFSFVSAFGFFYDWAFFTAAYFLWLTIVFLLVYFIFRQNIYLILFALSATEVLLLVINKLIFNIVIFAFLQAVWVMMVFIVFIAVTKIKKEKKGAISNN